MGLPYFWPDLDQKPVGSDQLVYSQLLTSVIDAASRIRAIALAAFHRGIPVQWFEFVCSGRRDRSMRLRAINARKMAQVRPYRGKASCQFALTVSNKESLVFWAPRTEQNPGVLFTADSDLATAALPSEPSELSGAIVTAPHHGSEANNAAYRAVGARAGDYSSSITWVRSDGRYRGRPGSTYLGLNGQRLCTLCRTSGGGSTPKQPVKLISKGRKWMPTETTPCLCQ